MNAPNIQLHGEHQTILLANEYEAKQEASDIAASKELAEAILKQYPGHYWAIRVQGAQGIATIHHMLLSSEWGYVIRLDKCFSASHLQEKAIRGAGELLERYNVVRGRANDEKMTHMATDFAGRVIGDKSK